MKHHGLGSQGTLPIAQALIVCTLLDLAINQMPFILVFIKQKYQSRWFLQVVVFSLGFSVKKLQVRERQCVA